MVYNYGCPLYGYSLFTIFVFFPSLIGVNTVNTEDITVLESDDTGENKYKNIEEGLNISSPYSGIVSFELVNRTLPDKWEEKDIYLRYTYLGKYSKEYES